MKIYVTLIIINGNIHPDLPMRFYLHLTLNHLVSKILHNQGYYINQVHNHYDQSTFYRFFISKYR